MAHIANLMDIYCSNTLQSLIKTGFPIMDRALGGGFSRGGIYTLGGFPGSGKSSFALNLARQMALANHRVAYLSLEMPGRDLAERIFCQALHMTLEEIQEAKEHGTLSEQTKACRDALRVAPLKIEDDLTGSKEDLLLLFNQPALSERPEVLIIDHIQQQVFTEGLSRADAISNYMSDLKQLAKHHDAVILVCSQFNRQGRQEKRPELWHLKSSGAIEEASEVVFLCEKANQDDPDPDVQKDPTEFKVRIAKNRRGPISEFILIFTPKFFEFREVDSSWVAHPEADETVVV